MPVCIQEELIFRRYVGDTCLFFCVKLKGVMRISLIFLSNELQDPRWQRDFRLPLEFISFGFIRGKLFRHMRHNSTFVHVGDTKSVWGNDVVYGGIFLLRDFDFYIRTLDAYHLCSRSTLMRNHGNDLHHRVALAATPIVFHSMEDFCSLKYEERESIDVITYIGNPTNPKIIQRLRKRSRPQRIVQGVDRVHYKNLLGEVLHHD